MKVIFLDFDGVLNVIPQGWDDWGGIFHPEFVTNLGTIVEETGAKLVISSSWRCMGLEKLKQMWADRQYPGEIIGVTQLLPGTYRGSIERSFEISSWLNDNPVDGYVIIDDDIDMLDCQLENFVNTANNKTHPDAIDIGWGLTKQCTNQAIQILNRT